MTKVTLRRTSNVSRLLPLDLRREKEKNMAPEKKERVGLWARLAVMVASCIWLLYVIGNILYDNHVLKPKREAVFETQMAELQKEKDANKKVYDARLKLVSEETERCLDNGGIPTRGYTDHIICIDRKVLVQHAYEQKEEVETEAGTKK